MIYMTGIYISKLIVYDEQAFIILNSVMKKDIS